MESQLIIGPSFINPLATARARSMSTFHFLEEVQRSPPSPSVETKPTYVVDAAVVRRHIASGIEPQVPIETIKGSYRYFLVSEIPGLNQWVYDPIYLHTENNGQDKKVHMHTPCTFKDLTCVTRYPHVSEYTLILSSSYFP